MCSSDPNLPKEAQKAKCFVISCFVFSIFSMVGFGAGTTGLIGGIMGILACVASSILMCCPPKPEDGGCKFMAAAVLLLIAGIVQIIMAILIVVALIAVVGAVKSVATDYCSDMTECATDDSGTDCNDGVFYTSGWCDDILGTKTCSSQTKSECEAMYSGTSAAVNAATDGVAAFLGIIMGIAAGLQLVSGLLNTIGGAYCVCAKKAMDAAGGGSSSTDAAKV